MTTENPVNGTIARAELGKPGPPIGRTRYSAIRRAMELTGRYVFVSKIREYLAEHPDFSETQFYKRKVTKSRSRNPASPRTVNGRKRDEQRSRHV